MNSIQMLSNIFLSITILLRLNFWLCLARDTITFKTPLRDGAGETLVSAGKRFELGFFTPNGNSSSLDRYVGIWYYRPDPRIVVWVANRGDPVPRNTGMLAISDDGNVKVLDEQNKNKSYWSRGSGPSSFSSGLKLQLMDSGNLVFSGKNKETGSEKTLWESFSDPTDTFLPGMKMDANLNLTSWTSVSDPKAGVFSFQLVPETENEYSVKNRSVTYWKSKVSGSFFISDDRLPLISYLLTNFSGNNSSPGGLKINITRTVNFNNTRLLMNSSGQIQFFQRRNETAPWTLSWREPSDVCRVYDACGEFASCNSENRLYCKCLPGFRPTSRDSWNSGDFSEGCTRMSSICGGMDMKITYFMNLTMMIASKPEFTKANDENACKQACVDLCNCQAYSFNARKDQDTACGIWRNDLTNIQEGYEGGQDLRIRVPPADMETTTRSCLTCGTTIIPYPLSTEPNCGDPTYFSFNCDKATGQLSFNVSDRSYRVTRISLDARIFSIQVPDEVCATHSAEKVLQLNHSLPFQVNNGCNTGQGNSDLDPFGNKRLNEVDIKWSPPSEPLCNSSEDCNDWPNSSCNVTSDGVKRCLCHKSSKWDSEKVNCTSGNPPEASTKNRRQFYLILFGVVASVVIVFCFVLYLIYLLTMKTVSRQANRQGTERNVIAFSLHDSERRVKEFIDSGQFGEDDKKDIDVPFIDLNCILAATDNFSDGNKLGRGGFGPVYKGTFPGGQEIAIKRLSSGSLQGLVEFKNEVVLIAKLQHRNLVRVLGYCIEGSEKMLVYEYMPNGSLDSFIFDRTRCLLLNWKLRFGIIMGIARGLLYLHHDSRLRIIHRDLKASNVLLDEEMNPKISDFGLARIFGGKQTEASTERVVGTYGYMSPEYALDGFFSTKSDVFSFGVVVLEILSGKRNTAFCTKEQALSLLGYAWRLWKEEKALDLMDQALQETCNANEFVRCANVGLLCVQEDPNDRPSMSNVIFMLGSEVATLPSPKQPVFVVRRSLSGTASSSSKAEATMEMTTTLQSGR